MKILSFIFLFFISIPSWGNTEPIILKADIDVTHHEAKIFEPHDLSKIKAILYLSPTIEGVTLLESTNAHYFVRHNFLVIVPLPFIDESAVGEPTILKLNKDFNKPALAASTFLKMAAEKYSLPANLPIFAMGASQGGIRTTFIAANVPGITAAWATTVGGDFASIYTHSTVKQIALFRKKQMEYLKITSLTEYEDTLRSNLTNDPLKACQKITIPWVQTMALKDVSVPTYNQKLIAENCPHHEVIKVNTGHVMASLTTDLWRHKIRSFFESFL